MAVTPCEQGWYELRFQSALPGIGRILPEVIDFAVGVGAEAGVVLEADVVLQVGGDEAGKTWVSGKHCQVETVLAIAIGVIEADAFRRVAEPIGLLFGIEIDDRNVLVHRPAVFLMAADGDVQVFVAFGFAQAGGNEAVQNITFTHNFTHNCLDILIYRR